MASPENRQIAKTHNKTADPRSEGEKFSGSISESFQSELVNQVTGALWIEPSKTDDQLVQTGTAAIEAISSIAPRNELEGMLAAQMVSVHNAAMECMRRAMSPDQTTITFELHMKNAAKFMSLYERQLAALDKHRGKGRQKITVEHVTVEAGGQAIVGEVHTEGKANTAEPKDRGGLPDDSSGEEVSREQLKPARTKVSKRRK